MRLNCIQISLHRNSDVYLPLAFDATLKLMDFLLSVPIVPIVDWLVYTTLILFGSISLALNYCRQCRANLKNFVFCGRFFNFIY
jgi:hypothetical protein